jgi:hypothetical protein
VIATLAGAACYSPGIQPCAIACSANRECPDGLTCNGQNTCAMTSTAMCDELPVDAQPDIDASSSTVTVEVRDRTGRPLVAALVIFADAAGALVAEMQTGNDGLAAAEMLPGGSATVVRTVTTPAGGAEQHVTTYIDLWPGAHVITQAEPDTRVRSVTVDLNPPIAGGFFTVHTSCTTSTGSTARITTVAIPERCAAFDVIATAAPSSTATATHAAFLAAQTTASISIPVAIWQPLRSMSGQLIGLPTNASSRIYDARGWVTPALVAPTTPLATRAVDATGTVPALPFPMGVGLAPQLTLEVPVAGVAVRQLIRDRSPATATNLNRDYTGEVLPWLGNATLNRDTRVLSWPVLAAQGIAVNPPTFFVATITYTRSNPVTPRVTWKLIGPATRINSSGNLFGVTYPDVPDARVFEPVADDVTTLDTISLYQVEPVAARNLIEIIEINGDSGYFRLPALRHVTISTSQ